MIRDALHSDIPRIVELGERFFVAAGWPDVATWCADSISETLARMIEADAAILLVADIGTVVGMAGGLTYPAYFNAAQTMGSELFWWVEPEHRSGVGSLMLDAMEARAAALGCTAWIMASLASQRPDTMARLYARRGYRPAEATFIKGL
jgi:GNAT superfamily N-acetyltransferase